MENGCDIVAAVAGEFPRISKEKLTISIHYVHDGQYIDTHWKDGRWLWTLRNVGEGRHKGCGYCETATNALKMAFAAASFVLDPPQPVAPPVAPEPVAEPVIAATAEPVTDPVKPVLAAVTVATGRHYRQTDVRFSRA